MCTSFDHLLRESGGLNLPTAVSFHPNLNLKLLKCVHTSHIFIYIYIYLFIKKTCVMCICIYICIYVYNTCIVQYLFRIDIYIYIIYILHDLCSTLTQ